MNVFPDDVFRWILTALVGGLSVVWLAYDARNLWRIRGADRADPLVGDRVFGYGMGIVVALVGIVGTLRYHGVL